jgi:hypothetical protein
MELNALAIFSNPDIDSPGLPSDRSKGATAMLKDELAIVETTPDAEFEEGIPPLALGIAPVLFSAETFQIGRIPADDQDSVRDLRKQYAESHAFRFDSRDETIANIALKPDVLPLGDISDAPVGENLLLLAEAAQHQLRRWLSQSRTILRRHRPLVCLGRRDRLLVTALEEAGVRAPDQRLDILAKWSFEFRLIAPANPDQRPWLGLIIDVGTSNVIDIPVSELIELGHNVLDAYVGTLDDLDHDLSASRFRLLGRIAQIDGGTLILEDTRADAETNRVSAADVFLEPRREVLGAVVKSLHPSVAAEALSRLQRIRAPYLGGDRKLEKIKRTVEELNKSIQRGGRQALSLTFGDALTASFGRLLDQSDPRFPRAIETSRPAMLFGPSGHDQANQPDQGLKQYGPFQYTHNPINDPVIAVLCDKQVRGRMDQFAKLLRDGLDDETGRFAGGLVGKFRLTNVRFQFAEVLGDTAEAYEAAANRVLDELPQTPALGLVQVRQDHRQRASGQNPYFVAKSRFMRAGVPVQAVRIETVEEQRGRAYTLNNLALATYAKIGGIPWVISTRGVATHEIVIGIGSTEIGTSRLGQRSRYVGITTLFQGDGRYLVWETTREAAFENYPQELLTSLRKSIGFVSDQNKWEANDPIRLIFHVYKPLKRTEIQAAKSLVAEMLEEHPVEFAFLDLSHQHPFQIFDTSQTGVTYWSADLRRKAKKGVFAPDRGTAFLIGPRTALLQLVGAREVKTWDQGMPRPLLLELHPDSDFSDLTYLVRQAYHFSFMSWRSFFPADEPVTILYSRWIANLLANLRAVPNWDASALARMRDRRAMWFL